MTILIRIITNNKIRLKKSKPTQCLISSNSDITRWHFLHSIRIARVDTHKRIYLDRHFCRVILFRAFLNGKYCSFLLINGRAKQYAFFVHSPIPFGYGTVWLIGSEFDLIVLMSVITVKIKLERIFSLRIHINEFIR